MDFLHEDADRGCGFHKRCQAAVGGGLAPGADHLHDIVWAQVSGEDSARGFLEFVSLPSCPAVLAHIGQRCLLFFVEIPWGLQQCVAVSLVLAGEALIRCFPCVLPEGAPGRVQGVGGDLYDVDGSMQITASGALAFADSMNAAPMSMLIASMPAVFSGPMSWKKPSRVASFFPCGRQGNGTESPDGPGGRRRLGARYPGLRGLSCVADPALYRTFISGNQAQPHPDTSAVVLLLLFNTLRAGMAPRRGPGPVPYNGHHGSRSTLSWALERTGHTFVTVSGVVRSGCSAAAVGCGQEGRSARIQGDQSIDRSRVTWTSTMDPM